MSSVLNAHTIIIDFIHIQNCTAFLTRICMYLRTQTHKNARAEREQGGRRLKRGLEKG